MLKGMVKMLLEAGSDPNVAEAAWGKTALMLAPTVEGSNVVQQLIDAGAGANIADREGLTALMCAVCKGNADAARQLVAAGADLNAKDCEGYAALDMARGFADNKEIEDILRGRG